MITAFPASLWNYVLPSFLLQSEPFSSATDAANPIAVLDAGQGKEEVS